MNDKKTAAARAVAKQMNLHVAPWLDAVAICACVIKAQKHRAMIELRNKWEAAGRSAETTAAVEAAFEDYMDSAAIATAESRRCFSL